MEGHALIEEWRPANHPQGNGYEVSSLGRVRSLPREVPSRKGNTEYVGIWKGRILKPQPHTHGYQTVTLRNRTPVLVHRLVGLTFLENPGGHKEINHKNGIKVDNRVENLEWCSRRHNNRHAADTGLMQLGTRHHASVLSEDSVRLIRASSKTNTKLAEELGVSQTTIQRARNRESYKEIS